MALNASYSFSGQQLVSDPHEHIPNRQTPDAYGFKPVRDPSNPQTATTTHDEAWQNQHRKAWTAGSSAGRTSPSSMQLQGVEASKSVSVVENNNRPAPLD